MTNERAAAAPRNAVNQRFHRVNGERQARMQSDIERDLGEQPIARLMAAHELEAHDLVAASTVQMTHKMVARACKGRRLTRNVQVKILNALNRATERHYARGDLFNYG